MVTLDPDHADDARYVLECKDRRVSLPAILTELAKAGDNRAARAAIAVFSRPDHAPVTEPFAAFGTRAIVVYDKDDPDPTALRVACAWARWITQRDTRSGQEQPEHDQMIGLLTDARRALTRRASVRATLATATKKIGEAGGHVDDLHTDLGDVLTKLELALAR